MSVEMRLDKGKLVRDAGLLTEQLVAKGLEEGLGIKELGVSFLSENDLTKARKYAASVAQVCGQNASKQVLELCCKGDAKSLHRAQELVGALEHKLGIRKPHLPAERSESGNNTQTKRADSSNSSVLDYVVPDLFYPGILPDFDFNLDSHESFTPSLRDTSLNLGETALDVLSNAAPEDSADVGGSILGSIAEGVGEIVSSGSDAGGGFFDGFSLDLGGIDLDF